MVGGNLQYMNSRKGAFKCTESGSMTKSHEMAHSASTVLENIIMFEISVVQAGCWIVVVYGQYYSSEPSAQGVGHSLVRIVPFSCLIEHIDT